MNLNQIKTSDDVYQWMDENIEYGWLDKQGLEHIMEMKDFRKLYRTMSVEEAIDHKMGTCIEQVAIMHELLDRINIENKMFCCRIFEPDDFGNIEEEEHMHCFVLFFENGKVYQMEHPNFKLKGIYEYSSETEAKQAIVNHYVKMRGGIESPTTQFYHVPKGMTFQEFNTYINHQ